MIIYSITTSILNPKAEAWVNWMRETHIPKVMATGYFETYHFHKILDPAPEAGTVTYNVQYSCASAAEYHYYITREAKALREEHEALFGKQTISFRTVLRRL